ncbi:MAG: nucleotidyltransferase domain-containing protein [Phycisphaeraceae bacterium]|nr:nucleotidyltransferase domain-containing protein [Phycisphaeraceae bacterium]MBX3368465.1 nucleotidyltransferase domain-containing protein [Phycisphaeraceae bacterium]
MVAHLSISDDRIADLCRRWRIVEFSLFGSVLTDDFGPDSDVDVLVAFEQGATPTLERWLDLTDELTAMFGRMVDLVERRLVTNPYRRHHILTHRKVLYAA